MDKVFDGCVEVLVNLANTLGMTYKELNVWLFCIILPAAGIASLALNVALLLAL